ncbi:MAG: hypothetical protein Q9183_005261, partial [Haloplaca sp. 2 TL-2023]
LSTIFEVLDIYEPSAEFEAAPDIVHPPPAPLDYTVETEEDSEFEALFAMTAIMDDLSRLRSEIRGLWAKYEAGKMDIAAVAVTTSTAIELARSYEDDIRPFMEKQGGSSIFHVKYFGAVLEAFGIDAEAKQKPTDDYNFAAYDIADTLFTNTLINIIAFVRANPLGEIPSYNGLYGWFDEVLVGSADAWDDNDAQNGETGTERDSRCATMVFFCRADLSGLIRRRQGKLVSPPLVQIFDRWTNTLQVGKGWTDLQHIMHTIRKAVDELPTSCKEPQTMLEPLELWDKGLDPIALIRTSLGQPYKDYTYCRRNFLHCGLWVHFLRTLLHQQGVSYASVPGTVLYAAQLYHALQQERCLKHAWQDMETLRKIQGNSTSFIGEPLSSFKGYFNSFCLTLGSSITN